MHYVYYILYVICMRCSSTVYTYSPIMFTHNYHIYHTQQSATFLRFVMAADLAKQVQGLNLLALTVSFSLTKCRYLGCESQFDISELSFPCLDLEAFRVRLCKSQVFSPRSSFPCWFERGSVACLAGAGLCVVAGSIREML